MISIDQYLEIIQSISEKNEVSMEMPFSELEMDSTKIVEMLIELEMHLDIDVLDAELDLNEFLLVQDAYDYVKRLVE